MVAALRKGNLDAAPVTPAERTLLEFVRLVTQHAYRCQDEDTQRLRDAGWTDPQIAEAVYITALFAFFNRVADAFGLEDPHYELLAQPPRPNPPDGSVVSGQSSVDGDTNHCLPATDN